MQIKTEHLTYVYSINSKSLAVKALDNVSLTINSGDFFGIIGHTGSGKSTFVQHLNGLIKAQKDSGKIVVGEFDLTDKKCDFKALRSKVGMVFQYPEHQLFAETVESDVEFGLKNFFPKMSEEERKERVKKAIERVGLDYKKVKDKSPFELSGGQKRRVAIAGVIVSEPEILILDEPAAGLDPEGKKEFIALLKSLHGQSVKTIVIVSHDMNLVSENCNRVAVFSHGVLYDQGTIKEVFSKKEDIIALGLELPLTAYLSDELEKVGINVDSDLTQEGFITALKEAVDGGKGL